MALKPADEILPGRDVIQVFVATVDDLAVLAPRMGTYGHQVHGAVQMDLHRVQAADGGGARWDWRSWRRTGRGRPLGPLGGLGPALASQVEPGSDLEDNEALEFLLPPQAGSEGRLFALRVSADGAEHGHAATVWLSDGAERIPGHVGCLVGGRPADQFGLVADVWGASPVAEGAVPKGLLYSPVTQCNLNCVHCVSRHTRTSAHRLPGWFKAQLLQWCRDGRVTSVACDYSGDILWADARFGGELDYLIGLDVPFQIDTNGVYLTAGVARRLVRSRLYALNVSLDAATEATYRRIRRGAPPLREVVANVAEMVAVHRASDARFQLSISLTLMHGTLDEWPDFIRLAECLGVGVVQARHLESYTPDMDAESLWFEQARYNEAREEAVALAAKTGIVLHAPPPFTFRIGRPGHRLCRDPWVGAAVFGNGDVAACCVPGMTMGNLHEQTMEEIWTGQPYRALRRTVNSTEAPAPCRACPYHRRHDNPGAYLFHRAIQGG